MKRRAGLLACAGMAIIPASAHAQGLPLEQGMGFSLKPRVSLRPYPMLAGPERMARIMPIRPIDVDDRGQDITVALQRRTFSFVNAAAVSPLAPAFVPRSRLIRYGFQNRVPIGDHMLLSLGWQGVKINNRNANVTTGASLERLRARDLFLPRASLAMQPRRDLRLSLDYAETLRAYGGTGIDGPLGLALEDFEALRRSLKPETQSRARLRAEWAVTPALDLSLALHGGRLDDRLTFMPGGLLPVNSGSARIIGGVLTARHRLTRRLGWSVRYSETRLHLSAGPDARERSLSVGADWQDGPLRATASVARGSAPAMFALSHHALRVEAGVDYMIHHAGQRPLRLSLRLTDPDGLVGTRFAGDDLPGPLRAVDQVRALMAGVRFDW